MFVEVFVEVCRDGAKLPSYAKPNDAGMDVYAAEDTVISPGQTVVVPTGIRLAIPEGYEIQVRPRSGISLGTPLRLANSPGTIDSGYRDELGIIISNTSAICCYCEEEVFSIDSSGNKMGIYKIQKGERIAQIVLKEVPKMKLSVVKSVCEIGENRGGGFGSTGIR